MRRPTVTDFLAVTSAAVAVSAAVAYALANTTAAGTLLALSIALVALEVRSTARDLGTRQADLVQSLQSVERKVEQCLASSDTIVRSNRGVIRSTIQQAERIEERTDAMARRILADIGASRRGAATSDD